MYRYSDSESRDSDEGIRFKTDSTRNKHSPETNANRSRSRSPQLKQKSRRFDKVKKSRKERSSSSEEDDTSAKSCKTEEKPVIGPSLPPHLLKKLSPEEESAEESHSDGQASTIIGPSLPPHLSNRDSSNEKDSFGPQLPPHLLKKKPCIGPQLPPHLRQKLLEESESISESNANEESISESNANEESISESNANEDSDDEEVYGPLPVGEKSDSKTRIALEERALQLKLDQLEPSQDKSRVREEWMLELPEVRASNLGLGPRQFRSKAGPDMSDRSAWTDAPNKKAKSEEVDLKKETEMREIQRRDREQERMAKKHRKKNKESLVEMHRNEMKKKKEEEGGPSERRPFSREIDLKVNRFDEAQKKAILKKAQLLDDRFSSGQSKFL